MGTNFYWCTPVETTFRSDDPAVHIGKRSAAGLYCWDCRITLCRYGEGAIHYGSATHDPHRFHEKCPRCGATPRDERLDEGAPGVELGFAKPYDEYPKGVSSCASFTWAQHPDDVRAKIAEGRAIVDEYGRTISGEKFLTMLKNNCPIQFHCIGEWFS